MALFGPAEAKEFWKLAKSNPSGVTSKSSHHRRHHPSQAAASGFEWRLGIRVSLFFSSPPGQCSLVTVSLICSPRGPEQITENAIAISQACTAVAPLLPNHAINSACRFVCLVLITRSGSLHLSFTRKEADLNSYSPFQTVTCFLRKRSQISE